MVLEIEDHGMLVMGVSIRFGAAHQMFGGLALDRWDEELGRRVGTARGCDFLLQMLKLFGALRLDQIKGKYVYALRRNSKHQALIEGLQRPEPDGGRMFVLKEWAKVWESRL